MLMKYILIVLMAVAGIPATADGYRCAAKSLLKQAVEDPKGGYWNNQLSINDTSNIVASIPVYALKGPDTKIDSLSSYLCLDSLIDYTYDEKSQIVVVHKNEKYVVFRSLIGISDRWYKRMLSSEDFYAILPSQNIHSIENNFGYSKKTFSMKNLI